MPNSPHYALKKRLKALETLVSGDFAMRTKPRASARRFLLKEKPARIDGLAKVGLRKK
jgi:hypothetical protein